jgi:hypothetical protein
MSDLEAVMERLLSDPTFQGALAKDPDAALAGYTLSAEDRELLGAPLVSGPGDERTVEIRTTKSSMAGLLGPVVSAFGATAGGGQSMGSASGSASGSSEAFGRAPRSDGAETIGEAVPPTETFGGFPPKESFGAVANTGTVGAAPPIAANYVTHVDVDGDGTWDAYTAYERADGGVDVHVDIQVDGNNDGVPDFIGHDYNRDGLIDTADYDTDHDGVMDTRMHDDNGDGWMDRSEPIPPPAKA